RMVTYCVTIVVFCVAVAPLAIAQSTPPIEDKINAVVLEEMAKRKIPGVGLAIVRDGKTILCKGFGHANVEHRVPVTSETIFQSGSVGKQFTAAAVMLLV